MNHNGSNPASREHADSGSNAFARFDPRLDPDDPDYDAEAEAGFSDWLTGQEAEWDEHDEQQSYSEGSGL